MKRSVVIGVAVALMTLIGFAFMFATNVRSQDVVEEQSTSMHAEPSAPSSILFSYQGNLTNSAGEPINNAGMPMTFRLFPTATGGSACWTENHTGSNVVNVQDGLFNVLLGQLTAIPSTCLGSNIYLEVVVSGETLSPRELFTSVAYAVEASTLPDGAIAKGSLMVPGNLTSSGEIRAQNPNAPTASVFLGWGNDIAKIRIGGDGPGAQNGLDIQRVGNVSLLRIDNGGNVTAAGTVTNMGQNYYLRGTDNNHVVLRDGGSDRTLHLLPWGNSQIWSQVCIGCGASAGLRVNGNTRIDGNLDLRGSCSLTSADGTSGENSLVANDDCASGSITSGAYIEANLQTSEDRRAERVERFEQGDLLCWSPADERLELCATANDRLVMAVANTNGKPIVIGAEPVKVLGTVKAGDILVSSAVTGYAMVNNDPQPGTVIGQALDTLEDETGLIRAMVRKW